jgi:general secretion pathway protein G
MTARARGRQRGFTLIELLIVMAIIGILASIAALQLRQTPIKAKEAALKHNLFVMRDVIDQYFADKGKYPESLETLVEEGYLRKIPVDPITESDSTWSVEYAEASDDDPDAAGGVIDVHSGATGTALDGSSYGDW